MPYDEINHRSLNVQDRKNAAIRTNDPQILAELAGDQDESVRRAVTQRFRIPAVAVRVLLRGNDEYLAGRAMEAAEYDFDVFMEAAKDPRDSIRYKVANSKASESKILELLVKDPAENVQCTAVSNPNTPYAFIKDEVERLLSKRDLNRYLNNAMYNPNTPPDIIRAIFELDPEGNWGVYLNINTPQDLLLRLWHGEGQIDDSTQNIRQKNLLRADCELGDELCRLAVKHPDSDARARLACNHFLPNDVVALLVKDKSVNVRADLAANKYVAAEIIQQLSQDKNATVCKAAIANPNLPHEVAAEAKTNPSVNQLPPLEAKTKDIWAANSYEELKPFLNDSLVTAKRRAYLRGYELGVITLQEVAKVVSFQNGVINQWLDHRELQAKTNLENSFLELAALDTQDWRMKKLLAQDGLEFSEEQLQFLSKQKNMPMTAWQILQTFDELSDETYEGLSHAQQHTWSTSNMKKAEYDAGRFSPALGEVWYDTHVIRDPKLWLISSSSTPPTILARLVASETGKHGKAAFLRREDTPLEALEKAAQSKNEALRMAVAQHPKATKEMLLGLAADADSKVRQTVLANPNATDEMRALSILMGS
jgi:hypothetical protein